MKKVFRVKKYASFPIKFDLKMKLTTLFIIVSLLQLQANESYAQKTKLTLTLENTSIEKVLDEIESLTEFKFIYKDNDIDYKKIVSVDVKKKQIWFILKKIFANSNIAYKVIDKQIILKPEDVTLNVDDINKLVKGIDKPQGLAITGTVSDSNGQPLPGANVIEKGTNNGAQTDFNGRFSINVADGNATLVVSFLGFATKEVTINDQTNLTIALDEDVSGLDEVVVIGYGSRAKGTLAGSVETIDSEVFESRPVTNVTNALQGAVPGLTITRSSSQPGNEGLGINLRGISSVNGGNSPLVLVDGIQSSLEGLNPNDIENISVLKDAAAAIYGNQAAGGVILVTTKKGKSGRPKVSYNTSFAVNTPTYLYEKLNIREFMETSNAGRANDGDPIFWGQRFFDALGTDTVLNFAEWELGGGIRSDSWLTFNNPDGELVDAVFGDGFRQTHNLNISGGSDSSSYYFSLGFLGEDGVINTDFDGFDRYNVRLNYTFNITDNLKLTTQNAAEIGDRSTNGQLGNAFSQVANNLPFQPVRRPDGQFYQFRGFRQPQAFLEQAGEDKRFTTRLISNYQLDWEIIDGLTLTANAGINYNGIRVRNERPTLDFYTTYSPEQGGDGNGGFQEGPTSFGNVPNSVFESFESELYANISGYLTYKKEFNGGHNLEVAAGYSHEQRRDKLISVRGRNISSNDLLALGLFDNDAVGVNDINDVVGAWTIRGLLSRINYTYKNKYILEANIRRDESSRFDPDDRAGVFSGYLAAWRASEEQFIKDLNIFDNLKFKVSYGETGNQSGINLYDYLALVSTGGPRIFGLPSGNSGDPNCTICGDQNENSFLAEARVVSLDRSWETIATTNFGIELGLLDNKLGINFDYFIRRNTDMLVSPELPAVLGANPPLLNIGELETKGWDLSVSWRDQIGENFNYYVQGTLFDNKNKLTNLNGGNLRRVGLNTFVEGYATGTYFGYQFEGIIQNQQELDDYIARFPNGGIPNPNPSAPGSISIGDAKYADLDGNGQLSALGNPANGDTGDLVELGNINPRFSFGLTLGGDYKGFDFRAFIQGVAKRSLFKSDNVASPLNRGRWFWPGIKGFVGQTWTPDNLGAKYPQLSIRKDTYNYLPSVNTRVNGAYARLKNLQIGYSLPATIVEKVGIGKLRVYLSGENIAEIQSKEARDFGFDPESGSSSLTYPFVRTFSLGLDVSF